jgi:hypothetical protein
MYELRMKSRNFYIFRDIVALFIFCTSIGVAQAVGPCEINEYSDGIGCMGCPFDSISPVNSTGIYSCKCKWNNWFTGNLCQACPANSISALGSTSINDCKCNNYYWLDGSTCESCPTDSWSETDTQTVQECFCEPDLYMSDSYSECVDCPLNMSSTWGAYGLDSCHCAANTYRDSGLCLTCPLLSISLKGSVVISACKCPVNTYFDGTSCISCTGGLVSLLGSLSVADCKCALNEYQDSGTCTACPAGSTSDGGFDFAGCACAADSYMDVGAKTCTACRPGSISLSGANDPSLCICPVDTYLANDAITCDACPQWSDTNGVTGATAVSGCICGQYRVYNSGLNTCALTCPANMKPVDPEIEGDPSLTCAICPLNTYITNAECISCPTYGLSSPGSTLISDCVCIAGTYLDLAAGKCQECGIGNFCPGNFTLAAMLFLSVRTLYCFKPKP